MVEKSNRKRFVLIRYFLSYGFLRFRVIVSISIYESLVLECLTMLLFNSFLKDFFNKVFKSLGI